MTLSAPEPHQIDAPPRELGGVSAELRPLVQLIREALGLAVRSQPDLTNLDWDVLQRQIEVHRLGGLISKVIDRPSAKVPAATSRWLAGLRGPTSRLGAANLLTMRQVMPRLETAGIPALVFKGPVLQELAYGSVFHRPSTDIDILVSYSDFDRAGHLLAGLGFLLAPVCRSPWWKLSLGEQHFLPGTPLAVTVDLHHRVQQPGCPLPLQPERFFQQSISVMVAGQPVPTLSRVHTKLLTAMSYVKALHHREPAARYLVDLAALSRDRPVSQWDDVETEARCQGLSNTLALAVRGMRALLGPQSLAGRKPNPILEQVSDETLVMMTLSPQDTSIVWPRRRALLHALYDRKSAYPVGLLTMVGSDILRRLASPTDRLVGTPAVSS